MDLVRFSTVLHGSLESNSGPALHRTKKTTAQSKPRTKLPSHNQTGNEQHYKLFFLCSSALPGVWSFLRVTLQTCAHNIRRTTHISQYSTCINTQVTAHQRSIPQAPTIIQGQDKVPTTTQQPYCTHLCRQVRQALNHHDIACTQHRRHPEHSQKACMVQKANQKGTARIRTRLNNENQASKCRA